MIGAGPAGAMAAALLARQRARVLLVDRASFPRFKVCGCCISAPALAILDAAGMGDLCRRAGAVPLHAIKVGVPRRAASLELPPGVALSRSVFDSLLIERARDAGAVFLSQTLATVQRCDEAWRSVELDDGTGTVKTRAPVVLAADGLVGRSLAGTDLPSRVAANARLGAAAIALSDERFYCDGAIHMACGRGGYVGLARLEDGRLNIAAALDSRFVAHSGGLGPAAERIVLGSGWPPVDRMATLAWKGTAKLTRHRPMPAAPRLFVLGDAASYVEPFTGEGIAWALASAVSVQPLALAATKQWHDDLAAQWKRRHNQMVAGRQRLCRAVAGAVRRPLLMAPLVRTLTRSPWLAGPFVRRIHAPLM